MPPTGASSFCFNSCKEPIQEIFGGGQRGRIEGDEALTHRSTQLLHKVILCDIEIIESQERSAADMHEGIVATEDERLLEASSNSMEEAVATTAGVDKVQWFERSLELKKFSEKGGKTRRLGRGQNLEGTRVNETQARALLFLVFTGRGRRRPRRRRWGSIVGW